jgi:hypothetical protein
MREHDMLEKKRSSKVSRAGEEHIFFDATSN